MATKPSDDDKHKDKTQADHAAREQPPADQSGQQQLQPEDPPQGVPPYKD